MPNFAPLATHELYMHRCLQLAKSGIGNVAPNPMVGAILVHQDTIIGEGYHQQFGLPHAEVNCINSVPLNLQPLIKESTLYVSLEPCNHFGKTPPCTDLIIHNKIPKVVIASKDLFEKVNGTGIQHLQNHGIEVITGILEKEALLLNKRFFTFHTQKRPYIILKWATTADGFIAHSDYKAAAISNEYSKRLLHRWRSEEAAIMVGTNTALHDNPSLTTRHWTGRNPLRIVIDRKLKLPDSLNIFNNKASTLVINNLKEAIHAHIRCIKVEENEDFLERLCYRLYELQINSLLVEGGAKLLQSFINAGCWDEARIITNTELRIGSGIAAPRLGKLNAKKTEKLLKDEINYFTNRI